MGNHRPLGRATIYGQIAATCVANVSVICVTYDMHWGSLLVICVTYDMHWGSLFGPRAYRAASAV